MPLFLGETARTIARAFLSIDVFFSNVAQGDIVCFPFVTASHVQPETGRNIFPRRALCSNGRLCTRPPSAPQGFSLGTWIGGQRVVTFKDACPYQAEKCLVCLHQHVRYGTHVVSGLFRESDSGLAFSPAMPSIRASQARPATGVPRWISILYNSPSLLCPFPYPSPIAYCHQTATRDRHNYGC